MRQILTHDHDQSLSSLNHFDLHWVFGCKYSRLGQFQLLHISWEVEFWNNLWQENVQLQFCQPTSCEQTHAAR